MRTEPSDRPNLLFIMADDLGWADLGCYGSDAIATPNLDRLAREGVRFTHAYSASPWCSPTRIALYTGRDPGRLAVGLDEPLQIRDEERGIPAEHPTLASLVSDAGYATAMFGKWHCGWLPWFSPLRIGFDTFFGCFDGGVDYHLHFDTLGEHDLYDGEEHAHDVGYMTDLIANRACDFVRANVDTPWYVQLNYTAPHWPWEGRGDRDVAERIRDDWLEQDPDDRAAWYPIMHYEGGSLAKYGELVATMDDTIGWLLGALDETGQADNTIVVFTSDNGGERWSKMWPLVGEKGDLTEGGIRVPCIVRWPGVARSGVVSDDVCTTVDWTATLLAAAGATPDVNYPLDGADLGPWLRGDAPHPGHDLFWRLASQSAMRRGRFKLLQDGRGQATTGSWPRTDGEYEYLYDVTVDGREKANIAQFHPEVVAAMRTDLARHEATLVPYPPDHRCLPEARRASLDQPAISQPD